METIKRNKNPEFYVSYFTKDFDIYYQVAVRKYYHFEPLNLIKPIGEFYTGSIYAPYKSLFIEPVQIPGDTVVVEHKFSILASKCPNGIDKYMEENIDRYTQSTVWNGSDRKAINMYLNRLANTYNVNLEADCLDYSNAFYW